MKTRNAPRLAAVLLLLSASAAGVRAQEGSEGPEGIPVTSQVVLQSCGRCHRADDQGRMTRISYLRKTPEGWQESVRRMVMLNGVDLDPQTAREVVRYLSDRQGIAPAELRPARWEVERRMVEFTYGGDTLAARVCSSCHSLGRVMLQRRTPEEWNLLVQTHRGYYPLVDRQVFYNRSARRKGPQPVDAAVAHFSKVFPLHTPEWAAWSATMRPPRLQGSWSLTGHDPARGPFFGKVDVTPVPGTDDEFTTTTTYVYPEDGGRVTRSGRSIVYTGYQWRGRSSSGSADGDLREVMMVDRGWTTMDGRWFTGANDELGVDVTLHRTAGAPLVAGVYPVAIRRGATDAQVRIFGQGLAVHSPADVDFGPGVTVKDVVAASDDGVTVRVDVAPDAAEGRRDLIVAGGGSSARALAVYDGVDRIEVVPGAGMARVGGANLPKQYQQFEAIGWADGADGKPGTDDDVRLGRVPVTWSLDEYPVTFDDDDIQYVGSIDKGGLFTPNVDGPDPKRSGDRDNVGDVWVVATYNPGGGAAPIKARGHLLVTLPLYMRWDNWPLQSTGRKSASDASQAGGRR